MTTHVKTPGSILDGDPEWPPISPDEKEYDISGDNPDVTLTGCHLALLSVLSFR
jgi:hypothetical protein